LQKRLGPLAPEPAAKLQALTGNVERAAPEQLSAAVNELSTALATVRADLPPGFCPPDKLARAIEAARRAKPDGIAIFAASSLKREKLWPALEKALNR
jgi:hypothetical protein